MPSILSHYAAVRLGLYVLIVLTAFTLAVVTGCTDVPAVSEPNAQLFEAILSRDDATVLVVEIDGASFDFAESKNEVEILQAVREVVLPATKIARVQEWPTKSLARLIVQTGKDPIGIRVLSLTDGRVQFFCEHVVFSGGPSEKFAVLQTRIRDSAAR